MKNISILVAQYMMAKKDRDDLCAALNEAQSIADNLLDEIKKECSDQKIQMPLTIPYQSGGNGVISEFVTVKLDCGCIVLIKSYGLEGQ